MAEGDAPRSSMDLLCHLRQQRPLDSDQNEDDEKNGDAIAAQRATATSPLASAATPNPQLLPLDDYLSLPPPRTSQNELAKQMVARQHGLDPGAQLLPYRLHLRTT